MNGKLLACIVMGVLVAHLAVFMILAKLRPAPPGPPPPPPPNFTYSERVTADAVTGATVIEREITVSTKLAEPGPIEGAAE